MIVSHKHKFIYMKTMKTASSSMEIALSTVLGPDDIITPARPDLDNQRDKGVGGQNYRFRHPDVPKRSLRRRMFNRTERHYQPSVGFYEHMPAWRARRYLGDEIWNSYYKFAFERNPWDRQVSWYHYKTRSKANPPNFNRFLWRRKYAWVGNYDIYSIDGEIALDFVGTFENVVEDFDRALGEIGLEGNIVLPRVNVGHKASHDYRDYYNENTARIVSKWYKPEIEAFGYEF